MPTLASQGDSATTYFFGMLACKTGNMIATNNQLTSIRFCVERREQEEDKEMAEFLRLKLMPLEKQLKVAQSE